MITTVEASQVVPCTAIALRPNSAASVGSSSPFNGVNFITCVQTGSHKMQGKDR